MEKITFVGAVKIGLNKYAKFGGRATRPEFWYFVLFTFLVSIVTGTIDAVLFPGDASAGVLSSTNTPVSDFISLLLLLPSLAVFVRRIRDTGRSAKVLFWSLLPALLFIFALVMALPTLMQLDFNDPTLLERLANLDPVADKEFVDGLVAAILWFVPAIVSSLAVQLYYFVVVLQKSKSADN